MCDALTVKSWGKHARPILACTHTQKSEARNQRRGERLHALFLSGYGNESTVSLLHTSILPDVLNGQNCQKLVNSCKQRSLPADILDAWPTLH